MIIYNHKKEFVGIEEKDLKALKLSSLAELQNEVADFADLFVKTPGFIHNFKHVHWIDFIKSADSIDENRVIISVKGRNFKAVIDLHKFYLVDDPQKEAYGIVLSALRELTKEENERISGDLAHRSVTKPSEPVFSAVEGAQESKKIEETLSRDENEIEEEPLMFDLEEEPKEAAPVEETPLELSVEEEPARVEEELFIEEEEDKFKDYHFDPELAAKELGLPTDLVEEFIQDFIAQAREFKPELYEALDMGRIDNLRMLSHKLKGVAANLRIEDAFDALVTINTSDDIGLVKRTLDRFYNIIIKKLAGEEIKSVERPNAAVSNEQAKAEEDAITLDLDDLTLEAPQEMSVEDVEHTPQAEEEKIELDFDEDGLFIEESAPSSSLEGTQPDIEGKEEEPPTLPLKEEPEEPLELDVGDDEIKSGDADVVQEEQSPEEVLEVPIEAEEEKQEERDLYLTIDKRRIASELGIDIEVFEELLDDYVNDMEAGLLQLEELLAKKEQSSAKKLALRLKGMSDNMHMSAVAEEFEHFIKDENEDKAMLLQKIKAQINSIERM